MKKVALSYGKSLIYVGINFFLAWLASMLLEIRSHQILSVIGIVLLGAAGLEKIGRAPQSWDGKTPAEQFDRKVFYLLSHAGLFLTFMGTLGKHP